MVKRLSSLETDTKKTKILLIFVLIWPIHPDAATRRPLQQQYKETVLEVIQHRAVKLSAGLL